MDKKKFLCINSSGNTAIASVLRIVPCEIPLNTCFVNERRRTIYIVSVLPALNSEK